jgi:SNF2 family DNA or RNA helicase
MHDMDAFHPQPHALTILPCDMCLFNPPLKLISVPAWTVHYPMQQSTTPIPLWDDFSYKSHQIIGINWMIEREKARIPGGILCDEMGLGKTIQMVGLLKNGINTCKQSLLVAPVAVLDQWAAIVTRSGMRVARPRERGMGWDIKMSDTTTLCIIGYEMAARHPLLLASYEWDRVIYDEAHRLGSGNKSAQIAAATKGIKWLLTATPIVNRVKDLVNLLKIVGVETPLHHLDALMPTIKTYVLARTMDQLRATMPDAPRPPPITYRASLSLQRMRASSIAA